ncbi:hypothetical protein M3C97_007650, partial [Micrococcus luteus]|nr:hypothetical protein [Micrococcus luteus]
MTSSQPGREDLFVPDRFENLRDIGSGTLKSLVLPVEPALDHLDERFIDIGAARRGGFQILRGDPGVGKSTFLDTVGIFRAGVVTTHIRQEQDIAEALGVTEASGDPRIIVIEGREALLDVSTAALESSVHAINSFLRSPRGLNTLVVWPANKEDLAQSLMTLGMSIGGDALLGVEDPIMRFTGPEKSQFIRIAEATVSALNEGASLAALGVSELQAQEILEKSNTLGSYLAHLRQALTRNGARVRRLLKNEQARLWTLVIAGNDPEGDVAALTRGGFAYADIERLMTSTGANVVSELKSEPDTLGILGTVLDAKVLHMDILTALAVIRNFASDELKSKMRAQDMSVSRDSTAVDRLQVS